MNRITLTPAQLQRLTSGEPLLIVEAVEQPLPPDSCMWKFDEEDGIAYAMTAAGDASTYDNETEGGFEGEAPCPYAIGETVEVVESEHGSFSADGTPEHTVWTRTVTSIEAKRVKDISDKEIDQSGCPCPEGFYDPDCWHGEVASDGHWLWLVTLEGE